METTLIQRAARNLSTIFDAWNEFSNDEVSFDTHPNKFPNYSPLGSGSDFWSMLQHAGIASTDFWYEAQKIDYSNYPLYHSAYENIFAVKNIIDRGYLTNSGMAKLYTELARSFADSEILPFDFGYYGDRVAYDSEKFFAIEGRERKFSDIYSLNMTHFRNVLNDFITVIKEFQYNVDLIKDSDDRKSKNLVLKIRQINDIYMNFEKLFLFDNTKYFEDKHLLYAQSQSNSYGMTIFPTLDDHFFSGLNDCYLECVSKNMKIQYSIICSKIEGATYVIKKANKVLFL